MTMTRVNGYDVNDKLVVAITCQTADRFEALEEVLKKDNVASWDMGHVINGIYYAPVWEG